MKKLAPKVRLCPTCPNNLDFELDSIPQFKFSLKQQKTEKVTVLGKKPKQVGKLTSLF